MSVTRWDDDRGATRVSVALAERSGWTLLVERDGQIVATEHHNDWHRVERRRKLLETTTRRRLERVAAALAVTAAIAAPVAAQEPPAALFPEPTIVTKAVDFVTEFKGDDTATAKDGFYPDVGRMITGAGWISFGPGYRHHLFTGRAVIDLSTAISWRAYKTAQARFEFPSLAADHVAIGSQVFWQDLTQLVYYGGGADSTEAGQSDYRLQASDAVLYAVVRPSRAVSLTSRIGWLSRPGLSSSTGPFDRDLPDTMQQFPGEPGAHLVRQPGFLHADMSIVADTRDHPGHPSQGGLYRAAWAEFRDRDQGAFAFERYEIEGAHFVPLLAGRSVLVVHGWGVFSTTTESREVPFYLLPSLGGHNTVRSYGDYRFHDRDMVVVNAESRWALMPHVDAALFVDAGNVAPRAADLNLARTAYGAGMRVHSGASTFARFDVAKGHEGWRIQLRLNDPFRFGRLKQRTAAVPFVP
ncbi:MAG TPA: BamA/TamA family outer membrane protein [Vicinamibacterales bacterium]